MNIIKTLTNLSTGIIFLSQTLAYAEKAKAIQRKPNVAVAELSRPTQNLCEWPEVKKLELGSEVKTYTFHYWKYAKENIKKFGPDLGLKGSVVGDFHFDNVNIYFNQKNNRPKFSIADLDDAGEASLLADYIKYIVFLKTTDKANKIDFDNVLKSYKEGIKLATNNPQIIYETNKLPEKFEGILKEDKAYFEKINEEYVLRKLTKNKNKFEPQQKLKPLSEIQLNNKDILNKLKIFFNQNSLNVLDSGYSINSSGSSKDMLRFGFLLEDAKDHNEKRNYELKQTKCPGTELFQTQESDQAKRYEKVLKNFKSIDYWQGTHFFSDVENGTGKLRNFILRLKQDNPLSNLEITKNMNAQKVSEFFALYLGSLHSVTANEKYINALEKNSLSKDINQFADNYLKQLSDDLKKNK